MKPVMVKTKIIQVESVSVALLTHQNTDFISLTDMLRASESGSAIIENLLRNKNTMRPTPQQSHSIKPIAIERFGSDAPPNLYAKSASSQGKTCVACY